MSADAIRATLDAATPVQIAPGMSERSEAGQAELIARLHAERLRYDHQRGRWLVWTPEEHRWRTDIDGAVLRLALDAARMRKAMAAEITDKDKSAAEFAFALHCESRSKLSAVLDILKALPPIADRGEGWDADPWLLGVPNGVVDLRTGELRDGVPSDRITLQAGAAYDPHAQCPRFEQFLLEALEDDDRAGYIRRFAGYALTGDTSEHALVVLTGDGGNGKSVLVDALRETAGEYAINLQFASLVQRREAETLNSDLARLPNRRLATSSEANGGSRLDTAVVKALTGDRTFTANPKYKPPFEFRPEAKFLLSVNELPEVRDQTDATWQRVNVVRFNVKFRGTERDDKHLGEKLRAEAQGILAWMVRGSIEWHRLASDERGGLQPPQSVLLEAMRWREASDPLNDFLTACCVKAPDATLRAGLAYSMYTAWCLKAGERDKLSSRDFGELMAKRFERGDDRKGHFYRGVGLPDPSVRQAERVEGQTAPEPEKQASDRPEGQSTLHTVEGSQIQGGGLETISETFQDSLYARKVSGKPSTPSTPSTPVDVESRSSFAPCPGCGTEINTAGGSACFICPPSKTEARL